MSFGFEEITSSKTDTSQDSNDYADPDPSRAVSKFARLVFVDTIKECYQNRACINKAY
jgi:hypothetical protein